MQIKTIKMESFSHIRKKFIVFILLNNFVYVQGLCTDYEHERNKHFDTDEMYSGWNLLARQFDSSYQKLKIKMPLTQQFHF